MKFLERARSEFVLLDGAMGTQIQALDLPEEVWQGNEGCNELLCLTAPDEIVAIHAGYLDAGSDAISTNTFGGGGLTLAEYGLEEQTEEINAAAVRLARRAIDGCSRDRPAWVVGSIGPGTKLISLGQVDFDTLYRSLRRQAEGLLQGGVDLFLIETCQDPLQIKVALLAVGDACAAAEQTTPIGVSVTVETSGTLLVGTEIEAVVATLAPFDIALLGMNCATGPDDMRAHLQRLGQRFDGPVLVQPNAGLPANVGGRVVYPLEAAPFATAVVDLAVETGASVVGGCCGTTPEHIAEIAARLRGKAPTARVVRREPALASLYTVQPIAQEPRPFLVGERANANGSKAFRKRLVADDWEGAVAVARSQEQSAHGVDLCVASVGRDEAADMGEVLSRTVRQVRLPIFIDSTDIEVIEAALKRCGGRPVINSVNLEGGEERAERICRLARRYGAALIALTIDEEGMALEVERKLEVAQRIHEIAVVRCGLQPHDLLFDALTFTLGSGDASLRDAGIQTLEAIRRIKVDLPGAHTLLGVSNISFGLSPASREVLNSVFLAEAVRAGLDAAIVNAKRILPLYRIDAEDRERALALIHNRGPGDPLHAYINHFAGREGTARAVVDEESLSLDEKIQNRVIEGRRDGLPPLLEKKLGEAPALEIVNALLIPAMRRVGELFASGEMQLPFVLQAAEVMKASVDLLEPHMERHELRSGPAMVIATVRGDVHDIGKNLVDIILTNNGFKVHNLGINCDISAMIDKAVEVGAAALGMSGLLVRSTVVMKENLKEMARRGVQLPVLLGGAALNGDYVDTQCASELDATVLYCADAFAGLQAMQQLKAGTLSELAAAQMAKRRGRARPRPPAPRQELPAEVRRDVAIPEPPFWGARVATEIDLDEVFPYLNEIALIRGRWGYRRGKLDRESYQRQLETVIRPELEALKARCREERLLEPKVVYGYFPCHGDGESVIVYHPETGAEWVRLGLPRQKIPPHRSIADFFVPISSAERDVIALQVATVGPRVSEEGQRLYDADRYRDYLLLHGLGVETAEALAEFWHLKIRAELGILDEEGSGIADYVVQRYRGARYSFGYPACPDMEENAKMFTVLEPAAIGVTLTEGGQMVPEQTTSAFVVHHPQAKYFTLS